MIMKIFDTTTSVNVHKFRLLFLAFGTMLSLPSRADNLSEAQTTIAQSASTLSNLHPWDVPQLNPVQQQAITRAKEVAAQLLHRPDSAATVLAMLNQYSGQDGYVRQELLGAIIQSRDYTSADLPFLKAAFSASLNFHYDEQPPRRVRGWYDGFTFRLYLSELILGVSNHRELIGKADERLLFRDPAAWLAKYAP